MFLGQAVRRSPPKHVRQSAHELRGEGMYVVAAGAAIVLVGWFVLLGNPSQASSWLPPLLLLAAGGVSLLLARFRSAWGAALLVLSILAGNANFLLARADTSSA